MIVRVANGKAVDLRGNKDHSFTRGFLCGKMSHYLERVYSDERVLVPLRRVGPKGAGQFARISWDEALDTIAARFDEIARSSDGPQAILPYSYYGTMGVLQSSSLDRRFFHRLGASLLDRTICASAGVAGYEYSLGAGRLGADPMHTQDCRLILNWGSNTAHTNGHLWSRMVEARRLRGARIVTIDPYRSVTAQRSDQHVAIRPGTDAALALGLMHVVFRDALEDREYVERGTLGADALRQRVLESYGPVAVERITGVDAATIEELARVYATTHPSLIRLNYGLQRHRGGGMAVRVIACLPALVGAWRHPGGGALLSTSGLYDFDRARLTRPDLIPPGTRTVNMTQLAEALLGELPGPPVRAIYVYNSNPAAIAPDGGRVRAGFLREDLFTVVHEQFLTDTALMADLVLPATTQLEHWDVHGSYGHHDVLLNTPAIDPVGESRSNADVFRALAARMGFEAELFPDDLTLLREVLDGGPHLAGIDLERLQAEGSARLNVPAPYMPFAQGQFPTPSGRCELYSQAMADAGHDPLLTYTPPAEDPEAPGGSGVYRLQLLSPPPGSFLNSTFANLRRHRELAGEQTVELDAGDAQARGLSDGQDVLVYNDRGSFHARVRLSGAVRPGVAVALGIQWNCLSRGGRNVNATTSTRLTDLGGGATFFDNLVEVRALESGDEPAA